MGDLLVSVVVPTFFPLVQVAPERSPTGFHSAELAATSIAVGKTLATKTFGLFETPWRFPCMSVEA